jgi:hypothetical protein
MDEFLEIYGICNVPEIRAVLWADIVDVFGDVPVRELGANNSDRTTKEKESAQLGAVKECGPYLNWCLENPRKET